MLAQCPLCERLRQHDRTTVAGVQRCRSCLTIHGQCYLGDSHTLVLPRMSSRQDMEGAVHYDLMTLGSGGVVRRHGWFDPQTKLILQVG